MHAIQRDHAADHRGVAAELGSPKRVAQDDHAIASRRIFSGLEAASPGDRGAQHGKCVRRNRAAHDADGFTLSGKVVFGAGADGGDIHGAGPLLEEGHGRARKNARDANQAVRRAIGQRANQQRIHQGEHGRIPADSHGQREDRNGRKARRSAEHTRGVTDILQQSFESQKTPHIPALLRRYGHVAHLNMAQLACGLLLQRKVEFEFLGQFVVELRSPPAKDEPAPGRAAAML